jgi:DNA-binding NarL/FixJ family response regulator
VIRVWIETSSPLVRAGFESLLAGNPGIEVVDSAARADVILSDDLPSGAGGSGLVPVVLLSREPITTLALDCWVRAILPHQAPAAQIIAALYAAAAGLLAVPAKASALLIQPPESEGEMEALTPRELEVFEMLAEGFSNKKIAAKLNISEHTAKFHVNSILGKLHAGTRTEAVMRGVRRGILKV